MHAVWSAIPPQPQIPRIPIFSESTLSKLIKKSTDDWKSSTLISNDVIYLGVPLDSPVNDGSNASVKNPLSANSCAYNPLDCSFTAP